MRENSWRQQPRELRQTQRDTHTPHKQERTDESTPKGDVNREQYRSPNKSHDTMSRQRRKPRASAEGNGPGHNSYSRTT